MMTAEQLQRLIDREAARQRQVEQVLRYRNAGDEETAHFLELPAEQQQSLLAQQSISDANAAARVGDVVGATAAIMDAVQRQIAGARLLPRRRQRG